jgi:hypothetical protein
MKNHYILSILFLFLNLTTNAQSKSFSGEQYGHVFNIGIGNSYYNYIGHTVPVVHTNYEIQVARNVTLAPFISFYTYSNYQYWGNGQNAYKNYYYRQTVIPIGVKGSYYFDELFSAGSKWDFYLAGSLGIAIRKTTWEDGFLGNRTISNGTSGLFLDGHLGFEYHINQKIGATIDLSTGISTLGLAIHL